MNRSDGRCRQNLVPAMQKFVVAQARRGGVMPRRACLAKWGVITFQPIVLKVMTLVIGPLKR